MVPAIPAITILSPCFEGGVVAVMRKKVLAVEVEAPDEAELDVLPLRVSGWFAPLT